MSEHEPPLAGDADRVAEVAEGRDGASSVGALQIEPLASYSGSIPCATLGDVFRYLVKFPDGLLHDPGVFVTAVPFWRLADTLRVGNGRLLRILAVDTRIDHTLLAAGIHGVFTVEVVR